MSSYHQGSKYIDIFCAQGPDPISKLRISGGHAVNKEFDSIIKGYVISLSGSPATTRIQLPKAERKNLRITNSLLIYQLFIPDGARTILEINVLDNGNIKRRLQLSSLYSRVSTTPLQAKIRLTCIPHDRWVWLVIDVSSLLTCSYPGQYLQYIDGVGVSGSCKIRRIASLRDIVIPSSWQPPPSVPSLELIIFNKSNSESIVGVAKDKEQMHIAFGNKILVPDHVMKSRPHSDKRLKPKPGQIPITNQETPNIAEIKSLPILDNSIPIPDSLIPKPDSFIPIPSILEPQLLAPTITSYEYKSLPRSAPDTSIAYNRNNGLLERGAKLDDDFISLINDNNENYDWHKYHNNTNTITSSSTSSNNSDDEDHTHQLQQTIPLAGNSLMTSSNGFDTLKMKLQALDTCSNDTTDIDRMGGAYSPSDDVTMATDDITMATNDEEKVELVYDKDLNCFYDPQTNKYYKLT